MPALSYLGQGRAAPRGSSPPAPAPPPTERSPSPQPQGYRPQPPMRVTACSPPYPSPTMPTQPEAGCLAPAAARGTPGGWQPWHWAQSHTSRKDTAPRGSLQGHSWKNSEGLATLSQGDTHTPSHTGIYIPPHTTHTQTHTPMQTLTHNLHTAVHTQICTHTLTHVHVFICTTHTHFCT